jgi:hypothetical protein
VCPGLGVGETMHSGQLVAGRYRLREQVGAGGNGMVWRATDEELDRVVAIKHALSAGAERGAEQVSLLRREARLLAKVNHPNVVTVFDVVAEDGEWWLVMEYLPAPDLSAQGTLPPEKVARFGAQLASGLEAVHEAGVVHRDIKPSNALVTGDRVKLGDFGISGTVHGEATLTGTGLVAGTPGYLAPEVAKGEDPTPASDVFSLGATLFAALEGVSPFGHADNPLVLLRRAADGEVAAPTRGAALTPVLSALLRVNPAKRPSAAQARRMLADAAETVPARRRPGGRRVALAGALVVLLATVIFAVTQLSESDSAGDGTTPVVVGDPRTADPCALTDPGALTRFGSAERETDYGNFNRCDVIVRSGESEVDVKVEFDTPASGGPPSEPVETVGRVGILRQPVDGDECERTLLLADGNRVELTSVQNGEGPADLCAIADTATTSAVQVLGRGEIPRRPTPARSLIHANACALLDAEPLSRYPGVDAVNPDIGFGDWSCRWHSTTTPGSLLVRFDRNQPLNAEDGRPVRVADRPAFLEHDADEESCTVKVVHRDYVDGDSQPMVELLLVVVTGPQPPEPRCALATALAEPAAAALPEP